MARGGISWPALAVAVGLIAATALASVALLMSRRNGPPAADEEARAQCDSSIAKRRTEYSRLLGLGRYRDAVAALGRCAELLDDDATRRLVAGAGRLANVAIAADPMRPAAERLAAMNVLKASGAPEAAQFDRERALLQADDDKTSEVRRKAQGITLPTEWNYTRDVDPMTGRPEVQATARSTNSLALAWPYAGENRASLAVRQSPRHGLNVFVTIDKGQFVCGAGGCTVTVRFDDQAPTTFSAVEPADYSSDTIFLRSESRFVAAARRAQRIRLQANIFQSGAPTLEFAPTALEWPQPSRK